MRSRVVDNADHPGARRVGRASRQGPRVNALTKSIGTAMAHRPRWRPLRITGVFDWSAVPTSSTPTRHSPKRNGGCSRSARRALRDLGATLGPEAAHHIALGAETLALRVDRQSANAGPLRNCLDAHPRVERVYHPSLPRTRSMIVPRTCSATSAPAQRRGRSGIDIFEFMNALEVVVSSSVSATTARWRFPWPQIDPGFEMGAEVAYPWVPPNR